MGDFEIAKVPKVSFNMNNLLPSAAAFGVTVLRHLGGRGRLSDIVPGSLPNSSSGFNTERATDQKFKKPAFPVLTMVQRRKRRRRSSRGGGKWLKAKIKRICRAQMRKVSNPILWVSDNKGYVQQTAPTDTNKRAILQIDCLTTGNREDIYDNIVKPYLQDLSDSTLPADITGGITPVAPFFRFSVSKINCRTFINNVYNHPVIAHVYLIRYKIGTSNTILTFLNNHLSRKLQGATTPFEVNFNLWLKDCPAFSSNFKVVSRSTVVFSPGQTREFKYSQSFWTYNSNTADSRKVTNNLAYCSGTTSLFVVFEGPPRHEHAVAETPAEIGNVVNWFEYTTHRRAMVNISMDTWRDFGESTGDRDAITTWNEINDTSEKADAPA